MSFLYPLFLAALATLAIPVLIHLFNLRKYKTVFFPHTRFLKDIQLTSRKQSQIRHKRLLITRLLFLAFLVFAFAQPFFGDKDDALGKDKMQIIYIDNSFSMGAKKGARTLLDLAKENALRQIKQAKPGTRFLLLTNDKPYSYKPEPADKVYSEINEINYSAAGKTMTQIASLAANIINNQTEKRKADLYYYSDLQDYTVQQLPDTDITKDMTVYAIPLAGDKVKDVYIDTAYLSSPTLQTGKPNSLIVHTKTVGEGDKEAPVLQLRVNGQVKSAATPHYNEKGESVDTLSWQVNDAAWQRVEVLLNDVQVKYNDTFRLSARSGSNLAVLVVNSKEANPYLQAAFRVYSDFRCNQESYTATSTDWSKYNLIIFNDLTTLDDAMAGKINEALLRGQSVTIFPARNADLNAINQSLKQIGDIRYVALDTASQTVASLQQASNLVKELFEKIPDNVQLPLTNWHYIIQAGLSANQQSVMSFRNGDPFLAKYTPNRGALYLCATAADLQSGNFQASYFFTPFLFQMAMQSGSTNVYAVAAGSDRPLYLSQQNITERSVLHLYGLQQDVVPQQRTNGAGVEVYAGSTTSVPGFYALAAPGVDSIPVAINQNKNEVQLTYRKEDAIKTAWKGNNLKWPELHDNGTVANLKQVSFPLWKVCVILALVMLALETLLLINTRKQKVSTAA